MPSVLMTTDFPDLLFRGKVRDTYPLNDHLLMVATDRLSAFDVVLPTGIPGKGEVLTRLSAFWFQKTAHLVPNHFVALVEDPDELAAYCSEKGCVVYPSFIAGRSMVVRRAEPIPVECVVRGYLSGSAWAEYRQAGTVHGGRLASGCVESQRLPEPIFTPTTKASAGHDLPLSLEEMAEQIGAALTRQLRETSLGLYQFAHAYALERGIILADTKFEFGWIGDTLSLIDELFTPDSSRFWPLDRYQPGQPQPSFDKQYVRDWLTSFGWNREPPAPALPAEVVRQTTLRYVEAYERLTGQRFPGAHLG